MVFHQGFYSTYVKSHADGREMTGECVERKKGDGEREVGGRERESLLKWWIWSGWCLLLEIWVVLRAAVRRGKSDICSFDPVVLPCLPSGWIQWRLLLEVRYFAECCQMWLGWHLLLEVQKFLRGLPSGVDRLMSAAWDLLSCGLDESAPWDPAVSLWPTFRHR